MSSFQKDAEQEQHAHLVFHVLSGGFCVLQLLQLLQLYCADTHGAVAVQLVSLQLVCDVAG